MTSRKLSIFVKFNICPLVKWRFSSPLVLVSCRSSIHMASNLEIHSKVGVSNSDSAYNFTPIGYIDSCFKTKNGTPRQPSVCSFARGRLKILKSVFQRPDHSLEGLQEFSHVWLVYVFHQNNGKAFTKTKVKPPRLNGQKTGVFACRSPYRPNPIGLTLARLESVKGDTLHLSGIDLIDGTPVLDIKPYIPSYDNVSQELSNIKNNDGSIQKMETDQPQREILAVNDCMPPPLGTGAGIKEQKCTSDVLDDHGNVIDTSLVDQIGNLALSRSRITSESGESERSLKKSPVCHILPEMVCSVPLVSDTSSSSRTDIVEQATDTNKEPGLPNGGSNTRRTTSQLREMNINSETRIEEINENCHRGELGGLVQNMDVKGQGGTNHNCSPITRGVIAPSVSDLRVGEWVNSPPIDELRVQFTPSALAGLKRFIGTESHQGSTKDKYCMEFFKDGDELQEAIVNILSADPRSTYRRISCSDRLYFFPLDTVHVTSWFCDDYAEILRVQPLCDAVIPQKK